MPISCARRPVLGSRVSVFGARQPVLGGGGGVWTGQPGRQSESWPGGPADSGCPRRSCRRGSVVPGGSWRALFASPPPLSTGQSNHFNKHKLFPTCLGPGIAWPNRAAATIRMFKKQVSMMLIALKDDRMLANITDKQLLRQTSFSRNTMVTHGGVSPIELAFGSRTADLTATELMEPAQLTTEARAPARQIEA